MKRNSQSGVALVITLILLSVITFMAISFLVISRQEAKGAAVLTLQNTAKNAADAALETAIAQANAQMLSVTNGYSFAMFVSTNIDQPFLPAGAAINIATNSYFDQNGILLTGTPFLQNLASLQILPRAPVFIKTTVNGVPSVDFRFYLDLNRNRRFDPSGSITFQDVNQNLFTNFVTGDPQWIGVLEHPDQPHSSSNKFIARYCFIALPIGNSLDINFIHNQAKRSKPPNDILDGGYIRNENVGAWEMNLAGFLANLNANQWGGNNYQYRLAAPSSTGTAFDDAASILQVKYTNNYNTLNSLAQLYPSGALAYQTNNVDVYASGATMTGFFPPTPILNAATYTLPWSGSGNPNAIFTPQDLFNLVPQNNPALSFSNRLYQAGLLDASGLLLGPYIPGNAQPDPYNQYTYYRMLQQMSFDSAPESTRNVGAALAVKNYNAAGTGLTPLFSANELASPITAAPLNLNYVNVNGISETNFVPWTNATMFFTNCADRLIRQAFPNPVVYYANGVANTVSLSITNIPLYPVNFYTPAVHRLLQLAANIYDAQTVRPDKGPDFPTVFRPVFSRSGGQNGTNIFISGYFEELPPVSGKTPAGNQFSIPLSLPENLYINTNAGYRGAVYAIPDYPLTSNPYARSSFQDVVNIYSAPWIIGAKKGFPNFNQLAIESVVQITRKLQVDKGSAGNIRGNWATNQMYIIGISNLLGAESWNSYFADYTRGLQLSIVNSLSLVLTNEQNIRLSTNITSVRSYPPSGPPGFAPWAGFKTPLNPGSNPNKNNPSFVFPLVSNTLFLPDSIWRYAAATLVPINLNPNLANLWEPTHTFPLPRFGLTVTNRLRYWMTDGPTGRLIDYVHFDGVSRYDDLLADSQGQSPAGLFTNNPVVDSTWNTNRPGGTISITAPTVGILQQLAISKGDITLGPSDWANSQLPGANSSSETTGFSTFINSPATSTNLVRQAPYSPTRKIVMSFMLQANDPLVHYTPADLGLTNFLTYMQPSQIGAISLTNISFGGLSTRYAPWLSFRGAVLPIDTDLRVKDPFIRCSDDWQFPENAFPNIGWLGRVHRGTPWQTVYLKSGLANMTDWVNYSGHTNPYVAVLTHPMNDWKILDLFTTAPNDNATRGQLSINNTNEAAWHAVLDGLVLIANTGLTNTAPFVLDPNTNAAVLNAMILGPGGINAARSGYPGSISTGPANYNYVVSNAQILLFPQPLNYTYANYGFATNFYAGAFTSLGQILSAPSLTVASPVLNTTGLGGAGLFSSKAVNLPLLSDAAYERIPQQILSLLRVGSPRYVIFAYGQALKPADHSVYQGGGYFGLVTNYAIAGEAVTRTVVDFANQIVPPAQAVPVFPPVVNLTTNYIGLALLPPPAPPKALVRVHTPIGPQ